MGVNERLVIDTNAAIAFIRDRHSMPQPLRSASTVMVPLPVAGELYAGAHYSNRLAENLAKVEELVAAWQILHPDLETARIYGELRGHAGSSRASTSRLNDLWIAALCIQHSLPLLTNDRGFDAIAGLNVVHW